MQQKGFVMLMSLVLLVMLVWPIQQLAQSTDFVLRQQAHMEKNLQSWLSNNSLGSVYVQKAK